MSYLLSMGIGIFSVAFFPSLPSMPLYFVLVIVFGLLVGVLTVLSKMSNDVIANQMLSQSFCLALGIGWGIFSGHQLLSHQLPDSYDKQQFLVKGSVVGLVENELERTRFTFATHSVQSVNFSDSYGIVDNLPLKNLLLSWYQSSFEKNKNPQPQINSGDHWQLLVRLRRPRGMLNQGGFDYQAWLIEQGYSATGYIVDSALNRPLEHDYDHLGGCLKDWLSRLREKIRQTINNSQLSIIGKAVISALTIGDKNGLDDWWNDLIRWGIIHLMVISGLHIGLVASLGFYFGSFINRALLLLNGWQQDLDFSKALKFLPPVFGFMSALAYSALAGFSLPTQRALIAVAVVMLAKLAYRKLPVQIVFAWAFFLIALAEPLAVLSASFWLSFGAVAILLLWFSPWVSVGKRWQRLLSAQLALFAGMAVLGIGFMGHISWLAPLVNLIAVPWISMITVPLCLLGLLIYFFMPTLANNLWLVADWSVNALWYLLEKLPNDIGLIYLPVPVTAITLVSVVFAALSILIPRGLITKWLCSLPLLLILILPIQRPPLRITVLDVGQGLAVVVESTNRVLVYDSGPAYSTKFDAGSGVVTPYLRHRGYSTIHKLLISHEDNDHAGGYYGLLESINVKQSLLGAAFLQRHQKHEKSSLAYPNNETKEEVHQCDNSENWSWHYWNPQLKIYEPIHFYVLMPDQNNPLFIYGNNGSCVLLIKWRDQQILLTGDIEKKAEKALLAGYQFEPVTLLVAPHHGSKTSSSSTFVNRLKPSHVVFSAGHRHHFGHPHASIVSRYRQIGSNLWNTAEHGGISFTWESNGQLQVGYARERDAYLWWR